MTYHHFRLAFRHHEFEFNGRTCRGVLSYVDQPQGMSLHEGECRIHYPAAQDEKTSPKIVNGVRIDSGIYSGRAFTFHTSDLYRLIALMGDLEAHTKVAGTALLYRALKEGFEQVCASKPPPFKVIKNT